MKGSIFIVIVLTSLLQSCAYHFYSQQGDVYAFDSAKQTKMIIHPYFNSANLHLGIGHSFTNHFLMSASAQGDYGMPFNILGGNNSSGSFSFSLNGGYFNFNKNQTGFEIIPGFVYETVRSSFFENYTSSYLEGETHEENQNQLLIPSIQPTIFTRVGKARFSFTARTSLLIMSGERFFTTHNYGTQTHYEQFDFAPRSFLFQPSAQIISKSISVYLTMNCSSKKEDIETFTPIMQGGIKFNPFLRKHPEWQ